MKCYNFYYKILFNFPCLRYISCSIPFLTHCLFTFGSHNTSRFLNRFPVLCPFKFYKHVYIRRKWNNMLSLHVSTAISRGTQRNSLMVLYIIISCLDPFWSAERVLVYIIIKTCIYLFFTCSFIAWRKVKFGKRK